MKKAMRWLILALCALLICGVVNAGAELVTLKINLTGVISGADGSTSTVAPSGDFRVYQNGVEIGRIAAGKGSITINNTDRIRIEPVPQSFTPGWDLSTAHLTPDVSGTGIVTVPVTIYSRESAAAVPVPDPEAQTPEIGEIPEAGETPVPDAGAEPEVTPIPAGPLPTPTLIPYEPTATATPEPVAAGLQSEGTGSLRVLVFQDKNGNGNQGNYEDGVARIPVYLLDEEGQTLVSAETDAQGFAVFTGLPAGTYKTMTVLPSNWYFSQYGGENSLALNAYRTSPLGYQTSGEVQVREGAEAVQGVAIHSKAATAAGTCWMEDTVDGLYKEGEAVIPGVKITLKHDSEDLVYETVTGEDGKWKIEHIRPGYYLVSVEGPEGLMLTRYTQSRGKRSYLTSDNPRRRVEIKTDSSTEMNVGFNWAAQIFGRCYLDANYNGMYDEGELPLAGVSLSVKSAFDGLEVSTAVSGEDGTYLLDRMRGDKYNITAMLPSTDYLFTKTRAQEALGSPFVQRAGRGDTLRNYTLADMERREMNIGAILPGSVKGTVYFDDNFSASADGNEKVVSGFTVTIRDAEGNIAATDKTGVSGVYELTGLTPGTYSLDVTAVPGYAFTKQGEGNVILNRTAGSGYSEPFRVELGEEVTGRNIGMIRPGTVKGTVFADRNDNGTRDSGEDGMTGTTVRLMSETEGECFRAEIGADGGFLFDAVMPGRYYVDYQLPERTVFARTEEGGNEITGENGYGRTESFDFVTGELKQAPLCGGLTLSRIAGTVYQDHNGDGLREPDEEAFTGIMIRLIPSRFELDEITAFADENGAFLLDDIRPDQYELEISCSEGYVLSRTDNLDLPLKAGRQVQTAELDVQMGSTWTDQSIGTVMPAAISGRVWLDENNNGRFDEGERTPEGYQLTVTDEATGKVFDTPVTDGEGTFSAAGMIPGRFTVSLQMDEHTRAPERGDSLFTEEDGALTMSGIELSENEKREGLLLGVVKTTSVSGRAWIDRGSETTGLSGLRISMLDTDGDVIAEAVTDGNGEYILDQLMPCAFTLEVTAPEGCVIIEPGDPRLEDGTLRSAATETMNRTGATDEMELEMDRNITDLDFGCVLPGRLGDYCWVDLNGDGLQAGNEPGLPGMRIVLMRNGEKIGETVTDQYGFYRFVDLYPATYTLQPEMPAEVRPTKQRSDLPVIASVLKESTEGTIESIPVTVESDRSKYDADMGFIPLVEGVLPDGAGEGETQIWTPKY